MPALHKPDKSGGNRNLGVAGMDLLQKLLKVSFDFAPRSVQWNLGQAWTMWSSPWALRLNVFFRCVDLVMLATQCAQVIALDFVILTAVNGSAGPAVSAMVGTNINYW